MRPGVVEAFIVALNHSDWHERSGPTGQPLRCQEPMRGEESVRAEKVGPVVNEFHWPGVLHSHAVRCCRVIVVVVAVLVLGLSAPLAIASGSCVAMGAMCDGPCGASSCVFSATPPTPPVTVVASAEPRGLDRIPQAPLQAPELPPK